MLCDEGDAMPVSCRMRAVPFLVEDELKAKGGIFSKAGDGSLTSSPMAC